MKREVTPNKDAIKRLRGLAKLTQSQVIDKGLTLSYRQYQRAEGGKKLSLNDLENIAKFYDNYLKKTVHKINVYVDDIILKDKKEKIEKEAKDFSYNIYLHRIASYEQLSDIIKQSKFQKIFYPDNPGKEHAELIKNMVRGFKQIYDGYNNNINKNTDDYDDIEKELTSLDMSSDFSYAIEKLGEKKLYLYANNFVHSYIGWGYHDEAMILTSDVFIKNYAIFCFKDFKTTSLTFKYETEYPKDRLKKIIEDRPWSMDPTGPYDDDQSQVEESFKETYKDYLKNNNQNFDKSKVSLIKTDIEELVDEDQLREYVDEEINFRAEEGEITINPEPEYDDDY